MKSSPLWLVLVILLISPLQAPRPQSCRRSSAQKAESHAQNVIELSVTDFRVARCDLLKMLHTFITKLDTQLEKQGESPCLDSWGFPRDLVSAYYDLMDSLRPYGRPCSFDPEKLTENIAARCRILASDFATNKTYISSLEKLLFYFSWITNLTTIFLAATLSQDPDLDLDLHGTFSEIFQAQEIRLSIPLTEKKSPTLPRPASCPILTKHDYK